MRTFQQIQENLRNRQAIRAIVISICLANLAMIGLYFQMIVLAVVSFTAMPFCVWYTLIQKKAIVDCQKYPATIHIENIVLDKDLSISSVDVRINGIDKIINIKKDDVIYPELELEKSYIFTQMHKDERCIAYLVVGMDFDKKFAEKQMKILSLE